MANGFESTFFMGGQSVNTPPMAEQSELDVQPYESSTTESGEGDTGSSAAAIGGDINIEKAENSDDRKELNGEAEIKESEIALGKDSHGYSQQPIMLAPQMAEDSESTYPIAEYSSNDVSKQIELDVQQYERSKTESGKDVGSVAGIGDDVSIEKADSSLDSDESMKLDEGDLFLPAKYRDILRKSFSILNDAKEIVKLYEWMCCEANRLRDLANKYEAAVNVATKIAHTIKEGIKSVENAHMEADTAVTQLAAVLKEAPDERGERVFTAYSVVETAMKKVSESHISCSVMDAMGKCFQDLNSSNEKPKNVIPDV